MMAHRYAGPRLQDATGIAAWTTQFLDEAAAVGLDKYFTVDEYADAASAALRVSTAKRHLIVSKAEAMEPEVPYNGLSPSEHRRATQARQTRVQDRVAAALAKEALAIGARDRRAAERYLLSAVDPCWHATLAAECGPYAKWKRLLATPSTPLPHIPALLDAMSITIHSDEDWATFARRLDGPANTYVDSIVAMGVAAAQGDTNAIVYSHSVGEKLRCMLLAHAMPPGMLDDSYRNEAQWSYEAFQEDLQTQWARRTETHLEEDQEMLLDGGGASYSTDDADGQDATTAVTLHNTEDEPMSHDAASSPTHRRAKERKKKSKLKLYCAYCHSKKHSDASCFHLAIAYRDKIVREGYTRPRGVPIPLLSDDLVESKRRFCTYCHSTKHSDSVCLQLVDDVRSGSVRSGYADPDGQLMPTPARVKTDDESKKTPKPLDTIVPKLELLASSLPSTAPDDSIQVMEPNEDNHDAATMDEDDDEEDEDDDVVITHVQEARSSLFQHTRCMLLTDGMVETTNGVRPSVTISLRS
ncbi:hypothetical protein, variant [Saprolegnia diclina VS20]|uniref:Uncharacterized protein n=1 Tax=Saprolegnia diclina (strain VS20) TaxID=1156394 RepID=T0RQM6_SAPDV|nr:hypothetical protein, variant [Saprolegnia diclina VS20]EQC32397.1 hypothetical protein, variant [Saprolegnia diclina VS20]|eukprot:XP_008614338.1 hypothetical protein, variant [Saprolegnia diclina VS20]